MSEFFQIVGLGSVTTIIYVFLTLVVSFIIASDDIDFVLGMAYLIGLALFVTLMICWAKGIPCPFAL